MGLLTKMKDLFKTEKVETTHQFEKLDTDKVLMIKFYEEQNPLEYSITDKVYDTLMKVINYVPIIYVIENEDDQYKRIYIDPSLDKDYTLDVSSYEDFHGSINLVKDPPHAVTDIIIGKRGIKIIKLQIRNFVITKTPEISSTILFDVFQDDEGKNMIDIYRGVRYDKTSDKVDYITIAKRELHPTELVGDFETIVNSYVPDFKEKPYLYW